MRWEGGDWDCIFVDSLTSPPLLVPCVIMCSFTCVPTPFYLHGGIFPLYFIVRVSHTRLNSPWGLRTVSHSSSHAAAKAGASHWHVLGTQELVVEFI